MTAGEIQLMTTQWSVEHFRHDSNHRDGISLTQDPSIEIAMSVRT